MALNSPSLKLSIIARPADGGTGEVARGWTVNLYLEDELVMQKVPLEDPMCSEDKSLCRWYLERFILQSPHSADLAEDAARLLEAYQTRISSQLQLQKLVTPRLRDGPISHLLIDISDEVNDPGCHANTIHQLHWEFLEAPAIWNDHKSDIVVRRCLHNSFSESLPSVLEDDWEQMRFKGKSINILLVLARNTSQNSGVYDDISPFLASDILVRIQRLLKERGDLELNVEIVRPGTFRSFEQHLQHSEEIHGPNYYHIVHFDLHGKVGTRSGGALKHGFLYFSDPNSDSTKPTSAHKIGRVLNKHKVFSVVLNACESARANCGDDANIAGVFQSQGVRNVLAMSFKVSGSAAEMFLGSFYGELLVRGTSFARAAAISRRCLRIHSSRPARFGLSRRHTDWFVPVVYSSGSTSSWSVFNRVATPSDHDEIIFLNRTDGSLENSNASPTLGREFDLLRLEKKLLQSGRIHLEGPAGVGKSTFLRYAADMWKATAFVDVSILMNYETMMGHKSEEMFGATILRLLLQADAGTYDSLLWTITSLSIHSYDEVTLQQMISSILSRVKAAFIFDELEMPLRHRHLSSPLNCSNHIQISKIGQFLQFLLSCADGSKGRIGCFLIFSARFPGATWLDEHIGQLQDPYRYEIRGLEMSDAIELSQRILREAGEDLDQWTHEDFDHLEQVIDLLEGIPATLIEMFHAQRCLKLPWRQFFERLHAGLTVTPPEYELAFASTSVMVQELHHLHAVLPKQEFSFLLLLGQYWHEAPSPRSLIQLSILCANEDFKLGGQLQDFIEHKSIANRVVKLAFDLGYLQLSHHGWISWIHSQFTAHARAWVSSGAQQTSTQATYSAALAQERNCVALNTIENLHITRFDADLCHVDTAILYQRLRNGKANLLTCINFCLSGARRIPMERWPLRLFSTYFWYFSSTDTVAYKSFYVDKFAGLLNTIEDTGFPGRGTRTRWFLAVLLFFVSSSILDGHQAARTETLEVTKLICAISLKTDQCQGRQLGHMTKLELILVLASTVFFLGQQSWTQGSEKVWQDAVALNLQMHQKFKQKEDFSLNEVASSDSNEQYGSLPSIFPKSSEDEFQPPNRALADDIDNMLNKLHEALAKMFSCMRTVQSPCGDNRKVDGIQKRLKNTQRLSKLASKFSDGKLENASELSPSGFDPTTFNGYVNRIQMLDTLERAYDACDPVETVRNHFGLLRTAMNMNLFHEAIEHVEAVSRVLQTSLSYPDSLALLANLKQSVRQHQKEFQAVSALFPSKKSGLPNPLELAEEFVNSMADDFPKQSRLALSHYKTLREEYGEKAFPTHIPRERAVYLLRKYGVRAQNPEWLWSLCGALEEFAENIWEIKSAFEVNDFDLCLKILDRLENLAESEQLIQELLNDARFLSNFREGLIEAQNRQKLPGMWYSAASNGDFQRARQIIEEITKSTDIDLRDVIILTELKHWEHNCMAIEKAVAEENFSQMSMLCIDLEKQWKEGSFPNIPKDHLLHVKSYHLQGVARQAKETAQLEEAIRLCEECRRLTDEELAKDPRAHDLYIGIKEECEVKLIRRLLNDAEINLKFNECLKLVDWLEDVTQRQRATPEVRRCTFLHYGRKLLQFLRSCYQEHCIECARWALDSKERPCSYDSHVEKGAMIQKKRKRERISHDRDSFRVPFGCAHHCRGGYCFFD